VVPFVGPSYQLQTRKADSQRTVNLKPRRVESGSGKAQYILESVEGLIERFSPGTQIRGFASVAGGRSFVAAGSSVFEIASDFSGLSGLATLTTTTGPVSMAVGREHLVVADGSASAVYYEFTASAGFFISSANFYASKWVAYIGGRFVFGRDGTDQFFWSAIDDPSTFDALDFATAESSPDGLVWGINYREELWLLGGGTAEVWRPSSSADAAFEKNTGVSISVGCAAPYSVQFIDNSLMWIGQDLNGGAVVYKVQGYTPGRASTYAVEEALQESTDISQARALTYQKDGQVFWCVQAPGVDTSWCYEVQGDWHERAELVDGEYEPWRATCHVYAYGRHLVGDDAGYVYELDSDTFTNNGDVLCRERTSPHFAIPSLNRLFFLPFRLDCSVGTVTDSSEPVVQLYYSNDGGYTWSDSIQRSLGLVGQRKTQVQWNRLGSARDRVWRVRCTDNVRFDIINADVQVQEGSA
jgi:Phage stabilisation protein